ncbi:uncharacterized protein CMU_038230 [Cryptosporidium muris RN66]|uniref:Sugar phosphate transporter domain-containing protein n=1 Tax=Cryptosporidium muris (strain RN66) TaxID=441375 RepID=B6A966_CRYMR|nr:uncharacterized protein CMU_038230 [Cryptosporidium muris RN66]EEA04757.1 hypothetical protein, conserved [Cryptosporidium muris RN66]|eukprot:XP_002139106.1 hypothetical protein [Cryptosporidium muris RN66]
MAVDNKTPNDISFMGLPKFATASIAIIVYMSCSIGCVYLNKWILTYVGQCNGFIPLVQQAIGAIVMRICISTMNFFGYSDSNKNNEKNKENKENIQEPSNYFVRMYNRYYYIFPAAFCFSATIILNNACLSLAKLSTYSVAKSTTLIWSVLFQYIMLRIKLPLSTVLSCFMIITGVTVGSLDPTTLAPLAVFAGCSSSIFQALYNTCIARALPYTGNDTSEVLVRNQELASIILIIYLLISGEIVFLFQNSPCFDIYSALFLKSWLMFILTTILAAGLNKFTFMVIGLTEPSTFSVIGFTKAALQTTGGWLIYSDPYTTKSLLSVTLTLSGSLIYGLTRSSSKKNEKEDIEQIRRLTKCSVASIGDIESTPYLEESMDKDSDKCEKQKLIVNKI